MIFVLEDVKTYREPSSEELESITMGKISLSGLAVAAIVGIIMNAFLPGEDYK